LSYQRLQRDALAIEDYTSALFLDSQFSHAYYSRGTLLRDGGQHLFALADFDKALRFQYPDPARVYVAQSATFEKLNRMTDAREALNKALAANPSYEPALKRLAVLDGEPQAVVAAADTMQTAAVTPAANTLPAAAAPPADLMGGESAMAQPAVSSVKLFTDRVPETVRGAAQPAEEAEERILAIEDMPEDQPAPASQQMASLEAGESPVVEEQAADAPAGQRKITGWSVQIASATTEDAAWSTWNKMKARHKALSGKEPVVVRADLGTKGIFYRVRLVGYDSQGEANRECSRLKSRGVKCFISRASS
jgi:tetratricopeptide (TPR) repeat protein